MKPRLPGPRATLVLLVVLAYAPVFVSGFVSDDERFIVLNDAIHHLDARVAVESFTSPRTQASTDWEGIYRPLRTLMFAIDWSIAGESPLVFHLSSLAVFLVGVLLVYSLFLRLLPAAVAFFGTALFALHPVQTESVAFVSSRGDLLLLVFFVAALLAYDRGKIRSSFAFFVLALLSKESAVVFPAAVLLLDYLRKRHPRWRVLAAYAGLAAAYTGIWYFLARPKELGGFTQSNLWIGGSQLMAIVTAMKGFLYYAKNLVLPVGLAFDYHVPAHRTMDAGGVIGIVSVLAILVAAVLAGRRSRFAAGWFLLTILPVSGIFIPMAIPTAERFLLIPSLGLALWAAPHLAGKRLSPVLIGCFLVLTFARALDWRDSEHLWAATARVTESPRLYARRAHFERLRAEETGDLDAARRAVAARDGFYRIYRDDIQFTPEETEETSLPRKLGAQVQLDAARALLLLGKSDRALGVAVDAFELGKDPQAHLVASRAFEALGRIRLAAKAQAMAIEAGLRSDETYSRLAELDRKAGEQAEAAGDREEALRLYRTSWAAFPFPENQAARDAIRRLSGE